MTNILGLNASDLAPGDAKSCDFDLDRIQIHWVEDSQDPWFEKGYAVLWEEFGARHEMEQKHTLQKRLQRRVSEVFHGYSFFYTMIVITAEERIVAVRDHTVILLHDPISPLALVHLSHVWVHTDWRRSGLTGWMRALPIQTARESIKLSQLPSHTPITLLAEMEHYQGKQEQWIRLKAYEKAGYRKIDPQLISYLQPDFRTPEIIDKSGGPQPLPMALMLRQVGRETEQSINTAEIKKIIYALYHLYGLEFRLSDMAVVYESLAAYPSDEIMVPLIAPTADVPS